MTKRQKEIYRAVLEKSHYFDDQNQVYEDIQDDYPDGLSADDANVITAACEDALHVLRQLSRRVTGK